MKNAKVVWKISKDGRQLLFKAWNRHGKIQWFDDKRRAERWAFDWK